MVSLKPLKCPVCGAPIIPSKGQRFVKCSYCGTMIDISGEKQERTIYWYYQPIGYDKIIDKGSVSLQDAIVLLKNLRISPGNPPNGVPEIIGFKDEKGSFIEFTRFSQLFFDVRFEDPIKNEFLVGSDIPLDKTQQMLSDFFEGKELRWKKLLKPE